MASLAGLAGCQENKTPPGGNPPGPNNPGSGEFTINEKSPGQTVKVTQGQKVDVTLTITRKNNFSGNVEVAAELAKGPDGVKKEDVPKQLKLNLVPQEFPGNKQDATVALQITAEPKAQLGDYGVRVTGKPKTGAGKQTGPMELTVHVQAAEENKPPDKKQK